VHPNKEVHHQVIGEGCQLTIRIHYSIGTFITTFFTGAGNRFEI
jgi:hypothetical protein